METSQLVPPALIRPKCGPCLSLYFRVTPADRRVDEIRLKALMAQAVDLLGTWNPPLGEEHSFALMQPLWRLLGTDSFWSDRRPNRAIFLAPGYFSEIFLPHHV